MDRSASQERAGLLAGGVALERVVHVGPKVKTSPSFPAPSKGGADAGAAANARLARGRQGEDFLGAKVDRAMAEPVLVLGRPMRRV